MVALVNSLPKSGTHLLEKALMILGYTSIHAERSFLRKAAERVGIARPSFLEHEWATRWGRAHFHDDRSVPRGDFRLPVGVYAPYYVSRREMDRLFDRSPATGFLKSHLAYNAETAEILKARGMKSFTILRDPRGVVASTIPFILDMNKGDHFLRPFFETLSPDERVAFILDGGRADPPGVEMAAFTDAFRSITDWGQDDNTLLIRFEDLVGPQGGGSVEALEATLARIAAHLGVEITPAIRARMDKVFDPNSPTFRGGRVDGWRERLTPAQVTMIETALGPELFAKAGYSPTAE